MSDTPAEAATPKSQLEITHDLTSVRCVIGAMLEALEKGPKSRERSLVATKLQEASMWANEGIVSDIKAEWAAEQVRRSAP